jgi:CRISPR-associated endonuclease Csn1
VLRLNEELEPDYLVRLGVRIFQNGRADDGTSLAVARRNARQQRRRRDRQLSRKRRLLAALRQYHLFPLPGEDSQQLKSLDPYALRKRALDERLEPKEIGRAIFHLNQRRGFRSNRRVDRADPEELGKVRGAIEKLRKQILEMGHRTVGEFLAARLTQGLGTRARRFGPGAKQDYVFYVDRAMIQDEFDAIWESQARFHPQLLTAEAREDVRGILFFQRPLRAVKPGACSFLPLAYHPVAL